MDAQVLAAGYVEALAAAWAWVSSLFMSVVLWKWFVPALVGVMFGVLIVVTLCQLVYWRIRGWTIHANPGGGRYSFVVNKGNGEYRVYGVDDGRRWQWVSRPGGGMEMRCE